MFLRGMLCAPKNAIVKIATIHSLESPDAKQAYIKFKDNAVDPKLKSMAAVSIAINYYQTVSALSQYFSLPLSVASMLSASKILSSATGAGVGLACVSSALNHYKHLYTAVMLEPIIVATVIALIYLIGKAIMAGLRRVPNILQQWDTTCLIMLLFGLNFLFFPISSMTINAFRCSKDPVTGISYNSAYPFALCDDISMATKAVAVVFYVGGILSLFSGLVIAYNRSPHGSYWHTKIGNAFGFFFLHYRKKYNFFAILVLFRRFSLSLMISVIKVNSVLSFGLVSMVLVISVAANHIFQPFKSRRDNTLETLTILAALFAYALAFTLSINELDYGATTIVIFYFMVNIGVVSWCAVEFSHSQLPKMKELYSFVKHKYRSVRVGVMEVNSKESPSQSASENEDVTYSP